MGTLALGAVRKLGGGVLVEVSICFGCALVVLWCFYVMILSRETGGVGDTILFSGKI
jgi:Fe-S-cluster-containing dehydrogenase component